MLGYCTRSGIKHLHFLRVFLLRINLFNKLFRKWRESQWNCVVTEKRIDGQVVVITGANAGLGRELAGNYC